jgi:hypothetical protein
MLSEKDYVLLESKTKKELLYILKVVCDKNENAAELLHNILHNKKTSSKRVLNKIFRLLENPTSNYTTTYVSVKHFLETSISAEDTLKVALESTERFIDELVSYDYMHPDELYDMTLELYDKALSIASSQGSIQSGAKLYDMIPSEIDSFYEEFINIFFMYFDVDEEENVTTYKGL